MAAPERTETHQSAPVIVNLTIPGAIGASDSGAAIDHLRERLDSTLAELGAVRRRVELLEIGERAHADRLNAYERQFARYDAMLERLSKRLPAA